MYSFEQRVWQPEAGAVAERAAVPDSLAGQPFFPSWPAMVLLQHNDGSSGYAGIAGPSRVILETGDVLLVWTDQILQLDLSLDLPDQAHTLQFSLEMTVNDPEALARWLDSQSKLLLTKHDLVAAIQLNTRVAAPLSSFGTLPSDDQPLAAAETSVEPLLASIGMKLQRVVSATVARRAVKRKPGVIIGDHWRLVEPLGDGAFGSVWKVQHDQYRDLLAAAKFILDPERAKLIEREAQRAITLQQGLDLRHLPRLIDVIPGTPSVLLYEFLSGPDLSTYVQERGGRLSWDEAAAIIDQLLSGLAELHRVHLIHRDLHPGNIKINRQPPDLLVKLLDLGLAWPAVPTGTYQEQGKSILAIEPTHPFAEHASQRGNQPPDFKTDLYGAGVLLWWLVTGQAGLPSGQSLTQAWPDGPETLWSVVSQTCVARRADRAADAGTVREALANSLARNSLRAMTANSLSEPTSESVSSIVEMSSAVAESQHVRKPPPIKIRIGQKQDQNRSLDKYQEGDRISNRFSAEGGVGEHYQFTGIRLPGFVQISNRGHLVGRAVAPGEYKLVIRASDNKGRKSKPFVFWLRVSPNRPKPNSMPAGRTDRIKRAILRTMLGRTHL